MCTHLTLDVQSWSVAEYSECMPNMQKPWWTPAHTPVMWNTSTQEDKEKGSKSKIILGYRAAVQASLGYVRSHIRNKANRQPSIVHAKNPGQPESALRKQT